MTITWRRGGAADAAIIAALHADSWRRHYRGAYPDAYLDGPADADRLDVWTTRLAAADGTATVLAEIGDELVGFVHVIHDADPDWGSLVDNLHVRHDNKGTGIGRQLMRRAAQATVTERPGAPLHLWVLAQNTAAQGFYAAMGGTPEDHRDWPTPDGTATVASIRYVWPDPTVLTAGPTLRERMHADLTEAMKRRDPAAVAILRTTLAAIANAEAVDRSQPQAQAGLLGDVARRHLTDDDIVEIVVQEHEELGQAFLEMQELGQDEAATELEQRLMVLEAYLPVPEG